VLKARRVLSANQTLPVLREGVGRMKEKEAIDYVTAMAYESLDETDFERWCYLRSVFEKTTRQHTDRLLEISKSLKYVRPCDD
jgi:hypothetical protein